MGKLLLYKELAKYYDLLYSFKNYKEEAASIKRLIKKYKKSKGKNLLELAGGTGRHTAYLKKDYSILLTDINPQMLFVARDNIKGVKFMQADMTNLKLGRKFDVILCLFSSIGYVKTYANLKKTIDGIARHLEKGGVVMIEPWLTKDVFIPGRPDMTTYEDEKIKIARLSVAKARGIVSVIDFHFLVAEQNKEVKYFFDRHEVAMLDIEKIMGLMRNDGIRVKHLKNQWKGNRGIILGIKK